MERNCGTCKNRQYENGYLQCSISKMPIENDMYCEEYLGEEQVQYSNEKELKERNEKIISKVLLVGMFASLVIGLLYSESLISSCDCDAAIFNIISFTAISIFLWFGIRDKRIKKLSFLIFNTLVVAIFISLCIYSESDERGIVIAVTSVYTFIFLFCALYKHNKW